MINISPFTITEFSRIFIESINKEDTSFKSQYILQSLAKIDPGCTYNITHDSDNMNMNMNMKVVYYFKVYAELLYTISRYRT